MHIELDRPDALASAISVLTRIAENRQTIPILRYLRLAAERDLHLAATDLTTTLEIHLPAEILAPGATTVAARALKAVALVPEAPVTLEFNAEGDRPTFTMRYGTGHLEVHTLPVNEFPQIPVMPPATLQVSAATLAALLRKTMFAICAQADRPNLTGLHLITRNGQLHCEATDGHRAVRAQVPTTGTLRSVLVTAKGLLALTDLAPEADLSLSVSEDTQHLHISAGPERHLAIKLIDGTFPELDNVFTAVDTTQEVRTDRVALRDAVRRLQPVAGQAHRVTLKPDDHLLTLTAEDEKDSASETVDAEASATLPEITFNGQYLLDLLDAVDTERVRLTIPEHLGPSRLEPVDDATFTHVIMPMQGK